VARKKKKAGRKPLPDGEAKDATLRVRIRPDDRGKMAVHALADGLDLSEWVRRVLLEKLKEREP